MHFSHWIAIVHSAHFLLLILFTDILCHLVFVKVLAEPV